MVPLTSNHGRTVKLIQRHQNYQLDTEAILAGVEGEHGLALKLSAFYQQLNASKLTQLSSIYSQDITFIDPVARHTGLNQLTAYFERLLKNCTACCFEIVDKSFHKTGGWMSWTMVFEHPRLNKGRQVEVEGTSLFKIANNKITYQRDYYDMGAMLYENVPLLGSIIKRIRRRLA